MVTVRACPKWSVPVTFGGGRIMENVPWEASLDGLKCPLSLQWAYQPRSTFPLSYTRGNGSPGFGGTKWDSGGNS